jgi:hypothetical protein
VEEVGGWRECAYACVWGTWHAGTIEQLAGDAAAAKQATRAVGKQLQARRGTIQNELKTRMAVEGGATRAMCKYETRQRGVGKPAARE